MAIPIDQTVALLVTEALQLSGIQNPTATDITRASDKWLRPVIDSIGKRIDLPLFETTQISGLKPYESRYALPVDFDRITEVTIFTGQNFDTLQSATINTVTLSLTESITAESIKGRLLFITSGVSINSMVRVIGYDQTTKVANISPNFTTLPSTDGYMIADIERLVTLRPESYIKSITSVGIPTNYHIYGRTPLKELYFDKTISDIDKGMIKIRYSAYPHEIDLTDARMTSVYNELMQEIIQGVLAYSLVNIDDTRRISELQIFGKMLFDYNQKIVREKMLGIQMFQPG